ncbi:MAG: triphosphoribosyl-dephospho-CoA synthase CitG [Angelakisella sp.]|nr:triphosphoribosyl-dephospho-CoA synthase CitG [Angelakisella sp.]
MSQTDFRPVTLEEMLNARERRALAQQQMLLRHQLPLICFTLNLAGPDKRYPLADRAFAEGTMLILEQLNRSRLTPAAKSEVREATGCELMLAVDAPAPLLKEIMTQIEEGSPLGRLFDIDVLDTRGQKVSRTQLGGSGRRCLICGKDAFVCARSRAHSVELLRQRTEEIITDYFDSALCDQVAAMAVRSILYEVSVTPKPGLVDRANSGSHQDMDFFTFIDSTSALLPYFRQVARLGLAHSTQDVALLFAKLRWPGMQAEDAMFCATGGINTHKGAIFSLGIVCAALGYLAGQNKPWTPENVGAVTAAMTAPTVLADFTRPHAPGKETFGQRLYHETGITGIRGEVAEGFPSVINHSLPVLRRLLNSGKSANEAGALTLLHLMAHVSDTNIISRSSLTRQQQLQQELKERLSLGEPTLQAIAELDRNLIAENLSPGGCADLLAVTFLLHFAAEADRHSPLGNTVQF